VTDVIPGGVHSANEAARWRAAARLRREHPRWVVIWLASAGTYRAYPLFRAPRETAVTAATPEQLAAEMDQVQQATREPRARSRAARTRSQ
jgi:hypothetical protein